jgi:hypothetical protein
MLNNTTKSNETTKNNLTNINFFGEVTFPNILIYLLNGLTCKPAEYFATFHRIFPTLKGRVWVYDGFRLIFFLEKYTGPFTRCVYMIFSYTILILVYVIEYNSINTREEISPSNEMKRNCGALSSSRVPE